MFRGQKMWEGEFPQLQVTPQCHIQEVFCIFLLPVQSIAETDLSCCKGVRATMPSNHYYYHHYCCKN